MFRILLKRWPAVIGSVLWILLTISLFLEERLTGGWRAFFLIGFLIGTANWILALLDIEWVDIWERIRRRS